MIACGSMWFRSSTRWGADRPASEDHSWRIPPRCVAIVVVAGVAALAGCGAANAPPSLDGESLPTVPARGRITRGGRPLKEGIITLIPIVNGGSTNQASGTIGANGQFSLSSGGGNDGALPGRYVVQVESLSPVGRSRTPDRNATATVVEINDGSGLNITLP